MSEVRQINYIDKVKTLNQFSKNISISQTFIQSKEESLLIDDQLEDVLVFLRRPS